MKPTVKNITAELEKYFPGLTIRRTEGCYYVGFRMDRQLTPEETKTQDMVCSMYETSLGVYSMVRTTIDWWVESVLFQIRHDRNLKDLEEFSFPEAAQKRLDELKQTREMAKKKTVMYHGKEVEAEDVTPTWAAIIGIHMDALAYGNEEGKDAARHEIMRLAKFADAVNAERKSKKA